MWTPKFDHQNNEWNGYIIIHFDANSSEDFEQILGTLEIELGNLYTKTSRVAINNSFGLCKTSVTIKGLKNSDISLWWPNEYGDQTLYDLKVKFTVDNESTEKTIKVGFR